MANNVDTATLRSRRQAALASAAWGCSSRQLTCSSRAAHVSRQLTCSVHAAASDLAPSLAKLRRRSQPDPAGARCCRPVASVVGVGAAGVTLAWTRAARFGSHSRPNARLEPLKAAAANGRHCCRSSSASTTSPTTMDSAGGEPEAGGSVSGASCVSCALKLRMPSLNPWRVPRTLIAAPPACPPRAGSRSEWGRACAAEGRLLLLQMPLVPSSTAPSSTSSRSPASPSGWR
mmetsp:Transcript_733/g.1730  ORF Transcript_733/g.1730 Transcript_733/m.1730 type:complete len:232 (+) Transcript_733:168-863(+)